MTFPMKSYFPIIVTWVTLLFSIEQNLVLGNNKVVSLSENGPCETKSSSHDSGCSFGGSEPQFSWIVSFSEPCGDGVSTSAMWTFSFSLNHFSSSSVELSNNNPQMLVEQTYPPTVNPMMVFDEESTNTPSLSGELNIFPSSTPTAIAPSITSGSGGYILNCPSTISTPPSFLSSGAPSSESSPFLGSSFPPTTQNMPLSPTSTHDATFPPSSLSTAFGNPPVPSATPTISQNSSIFPTTIFTKFGNETDDLFSSAVPTNSPVMHFPKHDQPLVPTTNSPSIISDETLSLFPTYTPSASLDTANLSPSVDKTLVIEDGIPTTVPSLHLHHPDSTAAPSMDGSIVTTNSPSVDQSTESKLPTILPSDAYQPGTLPSTSYIEDSANAPSSPPNGEILTAVIRIIITIWRIPQNVHDPGYAIIQTILVDFLSHFILLPSTYSVNLSTTSTRKEVTTQTKNIFRSLTLENLIFHVVINVSSNEDPMLYELKLKNMLHTYETDILWRNCTWGSQYETTILSEPSMVEASSAIPTFSPTALSSDSSHVIVDTSNSQTVGYLTNNKILIGLICGGLVIVLGALSCSLLRSTRLYPSKATVCSDIEDYNHELTHSKCMTIADQREDGSRYISDDIYIQRHNHIPCEIETLSNNEEVNCVDVESSFKKSVHGMDTALN